MGLSRMFDSQFRRFSGGQLRRNRLRNALEKKLRALDHDMLFPQDRNGGGQAIGIIEHILMPLLGVEVGLIDHDAIAGAEDSQMPETITDCIEAASSLSHVKSDSEWEELRNKLNINDTPEILLFKNGILGKDSWASRWGGNEIQLNEAIYEIVSGTARDEHATHNVAWTVRDGKFTLYDDIQPDW